MAIQLSCRLYFSLHIYGSLCTKSTKSCCDLLADFPTGSISTWKKSSDLDEITRRGIAIKACLNVAPVAASQRFTLCLVLYFFIMLTNKCSIMHVQCGQ